MPSEAIDPRQDILEKSPSSSPVIHSLIAESSSSAAVGPDGVVSNVTTAAGGQSSVVNAEGGDGGGNNAATRVNDNGDVDAWNAEKVNNRKNMKNRDKLQLLGQRMLEGDNMPKGGGGSGGSGDQNQGSNQSRKNSNVAAVDVPTLVKREATLSIPLSSEAIFTPTFWDGSDMLLKMLHFYADRGDIQMTVSCLLALDDKVKSE